MDLNSLVSKNQSIKIIPSIEDSLLTTGFNADVGQQTLMWLRSLNITWKTWKKSPTVANKIEKFFQSTPEPYRMALAIVIKCEEYKDSKPKSLPYYIIETLEQLSNRVGLQPDDGIKLPAFHIALQQRNSQFVSLVMKTYKVSTIKSTILPIVKDMISQGNHKQASQIVVVLELCDEIPVQDLLFPLVLQDKTSMVDEYLSQCPFQVKPFLLFLDELLDKKFNMREFTQLYIDEHNISHIKYDKLHYKPLGKLVARLCNKFKVPITSCKNLSKNRTSGGLRYLIYQKYLEKNVSLAVWEDLVKDALQQNAESAIDFIDFLAEYDKKEALKWAEYLNLQYEDYPQILKNISNDDNGEVEESWENEPNVTHEFYKLSLNPEDIIIIDTAEKFYDLTKSLKGCTVIGIDCEWKPSFGTTPPQVALIQLSTKHAVYLIDTLILNKQEFTSVWHTFYKTFLDDVEIIKVGFGLEQDLKEIKSTIIGLANIKVKGEGLLDLSTLWKTLSNLGLNLPYNGDSSGFSLSSLVQSCFQLPLMKTEQCSNWELRPLRQTQIEYAALDAYVLMEIYIFLQSICQEQGINFDEVCNDVMLEAKQKNMKKSKVADRLLESFPGANNERRLVHQVKFFLDPKLYFLMAPLRYFGIDTIVFSPSMLWHDVVNFAISEERLILLLKMKFTPTTKYPQSSIFEVPSGEIQEQIQKILNNFSIDVKQKDILHRCIYCNKLNLKKLSCEEINNLYEKYKLSNPHRQDYDDNDEEGDYNAFLSDSDDDDLYHTVTHTECKRNSSCVTSEGVLIDMDNIVSISESQKEAVLCETCGKLFSEEQESIQSFTEMTSKLKISEN